MTLLSRRPFGRQPVCVSGKFAMLAALIAAPLPLAAHAFAKGSLSIGHPWARETAQGQSAGGGFLTIANGGKAEDRLIGGKAAIAREVQIHMMSMDGAIMRMRPLKDGMVIPPGKTVALEPGGFHIMFVGLKRPLKRGEMVPVTLTFQRAGSVPVQFKVESVTYGGPAHAKH